MFLITNKHFNSQTFGLETVFSCWLLLLVVALTCCPSDWLIDDDETDVPSSHLPRRVFPVRLQNLSQLHLDQTQSCRCGGGSGRGALTALFALTLFILPRFIFFDRKWSYCWASGEEEAGVLPWIFHSEEDVIFFLPQEDVRWIDGFILWMLRKQRCCDGGMLQSDIL